MWPFAVNPPFSDTAIYPNRCWFYLIIYIIPIDISTWHPPVPPHNPQPATHLNPLLTIADHRCHTRNSRLSLQDIRYIIAICNSNISCNSYTSNTIFYTICIPPFTIQKNGWFFTIPPLQKAHADASRPHPRLVQGLHCRRQRTAAPPSVAFLVEGHHLPGYGLVMGVGKKRWETL